jgi:hypothetical protein
MQIYFGVKGKFPGYLGVPGNLSRRRQKIIRTCRGKSANIFLKLNPLFYGKVKSRKNGGYLAKIDASQRCGKDSRYGLIRGIVSILENGRPHD